MEKLKLHILNEIKENRLDVKTGSELLAELSDGAENREPVAVVGMALRCPQADNLRQFRCNLLNKTDSVREFPETRRKEIAHWLPDEFCETDDPYQIQGYLDDISLFDESFFGLSAAEAKKMHPIQRLFMMCAFEALEDAGYVPDEGMKTAVYVGNAQLGEPGYNDFMQEMDGTGFIGAAASMIPARIAYFLGLNGPGMVIDSACTSGLLGVHMACEALRKKEIDCAIVCGAALNLMPLVTERITFMESPEYVISPFDERADGTVWGEGAGVVVLKRAGTAAASKDRVYALIRETEQTVTAPLPPLQPWTSTHSRTLWTVPGNVFPFSRKISDILRPTGQGLQSAMPLRLRAYPSPWKTIRTVNSFAALER